MGRYPIYAIVAIVFIGLAKLLQVTVFDAEKYAESKKTSFSNNAKKPKTKKEKKNESKPDTIVVQIPKETSSLPEETSDSTLIEKSDDENSTYQESDSFDEEIPASNNTLLNLKDTYLSPIISNLPSGQLREDIVVRYYRHEKDGSKVYALKELGYYIHEKEATETAGLGSNILYYGSDVPIEDIQIIAYVLLEQELPLKAIEPTQFGWKSTSVEVGTDTLLLNERTLSESDIRNFRK